MALPDVIRSRWILLIVVFVGIISILFGLRHLLSQPLIPPGGKYPWGRDTRAYFGNGRFQVLRFGGTLSLDDHEALHSVLDPVISWKEVDGVVCAYGYRRIEVTSEGERGIPHVTSKQDDTPSFAVIQLSTGQVQFYRLLEDCPENLTPTLKDLAR